METKQEGRSVSVAASYIPSTTQFVAVIAMGRRFQNPNRLPFAPRKRYRADCQPEGQVSLNGPSSSMEAGQMGFGAQRGENEGNTITASF